MLASKAGHRDRDHWGGRPAQDRTLPDRL